MPIDRYYSTCSIMSGRGTTKTDVQNMKIFTLPFGSLGRVTLPALFNIRIDVHYGTIHKKHHSS